MNGTNYKSLNHKKNKNENNKKLVKEENINKINEDIKNNELNNLKRNENKKNRIIISMKDYSKYTFIQKIKIIYINYLNIYHNFEIPININSSIKEFFDIFLRLYNYEFLNYSHNKPSLIVIIKNKKYSYLNEIKNKYFTPNFFDYKNDYAIIIEKNNFILEEIYLGSKYNFINLKGEKISHFVCSSYFNFQIDSLIISKNIILLECEIYKLKKEQYFDINVENERMAKNKIKEFLDLNWKERSRLIGVIKSINFKKSKENYKANCFEIIRKFILSHGKIYIFLITTTKKIYMLFILEIF